MIHIHGSVEPAVPSGQCQGCRSGEVAPIEMAFAFQPIVDLTSGDAYAYEALVRGPDGESAASVLSQVDDANRYHFDQRCRTSAIEQAAGVGMNRFLSINFMPNAVFQPAACIRTTFEAAEKRGFPINRIIFETVESENFTDRAHLLKIFQAYKSYGFQTAFV